MDCDYMGALRPDPSTWILRPADAGRKLDLSGGESCKEMALPAFVSKGHQPAALLMCCGEHFLHMPRRAGRVYHAAARRYLRPWTDFLHLSPTHIVGGLRRSIRRGEVCAHLQHNFLVNTQRFFANYVFLFLATLFMLVCSSPILLIVLSTVGGGWANALKNDDFQNKPWRLQVHTLTVPIGSTFKTAVLSVSTVVVLHYFLGPILWHGAMFSGSLSLAHAALRDTCVALTGPCADSEEDISIQKLL